MTNQPKILVTGGTGTTGRRIVQRLQAQNIPVRIGSRAASPAFDWEKPETWDAVLQGIERVYIAFQPDLALPSAIGTIQAFTDKAAASGVKRLVLLSGRGEPEAEACEQVVQKSGLEWTVLRCSVFSQNFSERFFLDGLLSGELYLPVERDLVEPFLDVEDIADIGALALTEDRHIGQLYELSGPRLMTFTDAVAEIGEASGRTISYIQIPLEDYMAALEDAQLPPDMVWVINYLFTTIFDGRNTSLTDGVQRALGRAPRDFSEYVRETAATGVWNPVEVAQ